MLIDKLNTMDMLILKAIVLEYDKGNNYTTTKEIKDTIKRNKHYIKVSYRYFMQRLNELQTNRLIFIKKTKPYTIYLYTNKKAYIKNFVSAYFDILTGD